jgi:cytoskeletal protein CcmA (bactofilin family)/ribosomal protein L37AE/L43A
MRKTNNQEVVCPHCQNTQSEPEGMISTNCRKCGKYFKLGAKVKVAGAKTEESRTARAPKANREVFCVKCGAPNLVSSTALSTQCIRCSHYLELGDKVVRGTQIAKLYAYDDVLFAEGCSFKGMEATGRNMEVRGKVFSKLRATEEIVAMAGSNISGELHALVVRIERGATVKVQELECARLLVSGAVEITGVLTASEITLSDGAVFSGRLHIPESKLTIGAGATVQFDNITCDEITVEGQVTLGTSLTAEKVAVHGAGLLTAPVVRAARIEVSPGGSLQALIEKYVPRETPKKPQVEEKPEPEVDGEAEEQAEAA